MPPVRARGPIRVIGASGPLGRTVGRRRGTDRAQSPTSSRTRTGPAAGAVGPTASQGPGAAMPCRRWGTDRPVASTTCRTRMRGPTGPRSGGRSRTASPAGAAGRGRAEPCGEDRPGRQLGEPGVRSSSGPKFEFGFSRDCAPRRCKAPVSVCQQCCRSRSRHLRIFFQPMFLGRSLGQLDSEPALDDTHSVFSSLELLMSYLPRSIRQKCCCSRSCSLRSFPSCSRGTNFFGQCEPALEAT